MKSSLPRLELLNGRYAVCRLDPGAPLPDWAVGGDLVAAARSAEELSVICLEKKVPEDVTSEDGWRCLRVKGPLEFSLVGIIAGLASCLSAAGVSLFAISTFDTDYFLIQEASLAPALKALEKEGYAVDSIAASREPVALD